MTIVSKLDEYGIEEVCSRIEGGSSQADIARLYGISVGALSAWLNKPEHAERSARARLDSAESWLDKGLDAIERSLERTGEYDPAAAKAYEQACARRAALRNPQYRDKTSTEITGTLNMHHSIEFVDPNGEPPVSSGV